MQIVLVLFLAILTLVSVSVQRTYANIPLKELKHRARHHDQLAAAMLRASGYGYSLRAVLWFLIALCSAGFFVAVSVNTPLWFALLASGVLVWLSFVWLPTSRVTSLGERLAATTAPLLAKVVGFISPIIEGIAKLIRKHHPVHVHTGLYDRQDLIDLLQRQLVQPDNRIEQSELSIALNALTFGDETVRQHLTPRRVVRSVSVEDALGPILMDELHKSGHSRFPVYQGKTDNIIGTLYLRDLVHAKENGTVKDLMKLGVAFVHEEQSLYDALQAILRTHRQLFIVVNSFEEYVGIITIEDVLETILGKPIIDEFDQYDDLRAVAARSARKEHSKHIIQKSEEIAENEPHTEAVPNDDSPEIINDELIGDMDSEGDSAPFEEGTHVDLSKATASNDDAEPQERKRIVHREEDIDETIEL